MKTWGNLLSLTFLFAFWFEVQIWDRLVKALICAPLWCTLQLKNPGFCTCRYYSINILSFAGPAQMVVELCHILINHCFGSTVHSSQIEFKSTSLIPPGKLKVVVSHPHCRWLYLGAGRISCFWWCCSIFEEDVDEFSSGSTQKQAKESQWSKCSAWIKKTYKRRLKLSLRNYSWGASSTHQAFL